MRMTSFLQNRIYTYCIVVAISLCACVSDKSKDMEVPDWNEVVKDAKNNELLIGVDTSNASGLFNFTNAIITYFSSQYGIQIKLIELSEHQIAHAPCDIVYTKRFKLNQMYKNNLLFGPFRDKLPHSKYLYWDIYYDRNSIDILDEYMGCWGNIDVSFHRKPNNIVIIPNTLMELEQIVNANPYLYTIGRGRVALKIFSNIIAQVARDNKQDLSTYNPEVFEKLKEDLDLKLSDIRSKFWRKGLINFAQLDFSNSSIMSKEDSVANRTLPSNDINDMLCLAIPTNSTEKKTAMFVINQLVSPQLRMKRINSILDEELIANLSLAKGIDSNYIIRYYDDFKYCKDE